jgi:hypothetical protein
LDLLISYFGPTHQASKYDAISILGQNVAVHKTTTSSATNSNKRTNNYAIIIIIIGSINPNSMLGLYSDNVHLHRHGLYTTTTASTTTSSFDCQINNDNDITVQKTFFS